MLSQQSQRSCSRERKNITEAKDKLRKRLHAASVKKLNEKETNAQEPNVRRRSRKRPSVKEAKDKERSEKAGKVAQI